MRRLRHFGRIVLVIALIALSIIVIPLTGVVLECRPFAQPPLAGNGTLPGSRPDVTATLNNYIRLEDQTYLTVPEWYIVYSADEYGDFLKRREPSQFPYFRAIIQFWNSYYDVCHITRERYSFNSGYHLTLIIIGTSFTFENIVKGLYEGTVGRLAEWASSNKLTAEELYARQVAEEYGRFIHTTPWYEFPYAERLAGLWNETGWWGPNAFRKWERKFALSIEYGGKSIYARLIKWGTQNAYASEDLEILAWVDGVSEEILQQSPEIKVIEEFDDQAAIVSLPRYEAFTQVVPELAGQGLRFVEIAGNDEILITAIAPVDWRYDLPAGEVLFTLEILTRPALQRVVIRAPVNSLHTILVGLENSQAQLEHVYDY